MPGRFSRRVLIHQTLKQYSNTLKPHHRRNSSHDGEGYCAAALEVQLLVQSVEPSPVMLEKAPRLERPLERYLVGLGGVTKEGRNNMLSSNTNANSSRCNSNKHRLLTKVATPINAR
jgi:hypothetical protein